MSAATPLASYLDDRTSPACQVLKYCDGVVEDLLAADSIPVLTQPPSDVDAVPMQGATQRQLARE